MRAGVRSREIPASREKSRELKTIPVKTLKFCPKSADFASEQGISREFLVFAVKVTKATALPTFRDSLA
jgi:hypothetical protein